MAKNADNRKNFGKYYNAINLFGKEVLVRLLKWFYKGGDRNFLDYLMCEYDLSGMNSLIDATRRYDLRHKKPEEFDMTLIHVLLQLACNLYMENEQDNKDDPGYNVLEIGIEKVMRQFIEAGRMKQSLSENEMEEKLYDLRKLYEELIMTGGKLGRINATEVTDFFEHISFGVMYLNSYVSKYNPHINENFTKEMKLLYALDVQTQVEVNAQNKANDSITCIKDIREMKFAAKAGKMKKHSLQATAERESEQFMDEDDSIKKKGNSRESQIKGSNKVKSCTQHSEKSMSAEKSKPVEKISSSHNNDSLQPELNFGATDDDSCVNPTLQAVRKARLGGVIGEVIRADYFRHMDSAVCAENTDIVFPPPDIDVLLQQHQKYSRRPGQQVKLRDLLTVKGMNDDNAEIIIVSGDPGIGKTTLSKYILEEWRKGQTTIDELKSRKMLFYHELTSNTHKSLTELIYRTFYEFLSSLDDSTFTENYVGEMVKEIVLEYSILIILDGYEDSCENSHQLVKDVLDTNGSNMKVIITSRPQYVDSYYRQIPKVRKRHVTHLGLNGIPSSYQADFMNKLMDCTLAARNMKDINLDKIKGDLINRLPDIYDVLREDTSNPLMLKILTEMWISNLSN